jgi:hypothetical protein
VTATPTVVHLTVVSGARAACAVPFPPLDVELALPYGGLVEHALTERTVGAVLVRRGGFATGVFHGATLLASKVGARPVPGRSAAGGWSQQRFARRRAEAARRAFDAASTTAIRVLAPFAGRLEALVVGGDRTALDAVLATVLADRRLAVLRGLPVVTVPDVPEPRHRVLADLPRRFRAVRITVTDPPPSGPRVSAL